MGVVAKLVLTFVRIYATFFDLFTLPFYLLLQKPWILWAERKRPQSRPVEPGNPYSPMVYIETEGTDSPHPDVTEVDTVDQLWENSVKRYHSRDCFGIREVLREEVDSRGMKKMMLGSYKWISYLQAADKVNNLCRSMLEMGVKPGQMVAILSETRMEWILTALACHRIGCPLVTLYANLGSEAILYGLQETEVEVLFISSELMKKISGSVLEGTKVRHLVYYEGSKKPDTSKVPEAISPLSFSQLEMKGRQPLTGENGLNSIPLPKPDDILIMMYTSGSTGLPKAVEIRHKQVIWTIKEYAPLLPPTTPSSKHAAYLPLAHILELFSEYTFMWIGVPIGYSSSLTLMRNSTGLMPGCKPDIEILRPHAMMTVPLVMDRVSKGISTLMTTKGAIVKALFDYAMEYKKRWWLRGFDTPLLDMFVFRQCKQLLGGQVQMAICAGAPLSPTTEEFIRTVLCVKLVPAYGMTETCCTGTCGINDFRVIGEVGPPRGAYVALSDWEEGGYRVTDKPNPRGEILIGGNGVALGYFKQPQLTKEAFFVKDGVQYVRTGDIGELTPQGTFKVIDRKKDLLKLQHGEYISLGKVEAALKTSPLVDNVCVYGHGFSSFVVALVCPNHFQLDLVAKKVRRDGLTFESKCRDKEIVDIFTKRLKEHALKCGLKSVEIPAKYKLVPESWTPDNGMVTAAFKIRRRVIQDHYMKDLLLMYKEN